MFNYPLASYVYIGLTTNNIIAIPSRAFNFSLASKTFYLILNKNQITTVPSGMFNFTLASSVTIDLSYNQITTIPPNIICFFM